MFLAISKGSSGTGDEKYHLYLPFFISSGSEISHIDFEQKFKISEHEIWFEKIQNYYALVMGDFFSEEEALRYFGKLKAAFYWTSLIHRIGFDLPEELNSVTLYDEPIFVSEDSPVKSITELAGWKTIDGTYDTDKCVFRPEHKRLIRFELGKFGVTAGIGAGSFIESISEAMSFRSPEQIQNNPRLQLAMELYSSFFFEQSIEAKFIKLVTVMEALLPEYKVEGTSISVIKEVKRNIKKQRDAYNKALNEWKELNDLVCRIGELTRQSIGSSLRTYISELMDKNQGLGNKEEIVNKLKDLYSIRSKLVHGESTNKNAIQESLEFLIEFIPKLLKLLYRLEATEQN